MKNDQRNYRMSQKKFRCLGGYGMKIIWAIFKTKMLTCLSKAILDEKILFGKINHQSDPEIRQMLEGACFAIKNSTFHSSP